MATTKADNITLLDADPREIMETGSVFGSVRVFQDTAAVADGDFDADDDIVTLAEVPSNAKIVSIRIANDGLDTANESLVNVGLYNGSRSFVDNGTTFAADAVIDEDSYATVSADFQTGGAAMTEYAFEARDINAVNNYVWEDAGLNADPGVPLRIAITQTAAVTTDAAGDVSIIVEYVVD